VYSLNDVVRYFVQYDFVVWCVCVYKYIELTSRNILYNSFKLIACTCSFLCQLVNIRIFIF